MDRIDPREVTDAAGQATRALLAAFERSPAGVIELSPDARIRTANVAACGLLGTDNSGLVGRSWTDLLNPPEADEGADDIAELLRGGAQSARFVRRVARPDGTARWADLSCSVVMGPDDVVEGLLVVCSDVTEQVEATERLRHQLRHSSEVLFTIDPQAMILWASDGIASILGFTADEIVGTWAMGLVHPDDRGPAAEALSAALSGAEVEIELRLMARDGRTVWAAWSAATRIDEDGAVQIVGAWRDVTRYREAIQELTGAEARYRALAENAAELVVQSRNGTIEWVSPSVTVALGGTTEDWTGLHLTEVLHPDDLFLFDPTTARVDGGRAMVARARVRAMDGSYHWIEARSRPLMDADGVVSSHITSARVIDELVIAEDSLRHEATHDSLTGLLNRREIVERLVGMSRHLPRTGEHTALLYCDLDNLKDINDTYGHGAGDEVLRTLGERLNGLVRADDLVARIGGDELLVVLTGVHSLEEASALAEKIRESASQDIGVGGARVRCTLSIGATLARTAEAVDDVIARADAALYSAKDAGRNRVVAVP